jgi:glyoxylase-like metal-dependent hydrolase (beta-lactamase superfamily II)
MSKVLLTHMHPDHSAGLMIQDGRRFSMLNWSCTKMSRATGTTTRQRASERAGLYPGAREQMAPITTMHTFSGSVEVFPGVTSVLLHGHTPGNSGYMVSSGKESLLIWGDIVHVPDIQIPRPEVTIEFDTDPHAAAATRKRVLDMVATDRQLVAGMHMHYPGFAHVVRQADSYLMLPEPWDQAF